MEGKIFLITGPSGVGKGTIREELLKIEDLGIKLSISCTTRKPRPGEKDGREYYFLSKEEFEAKIKNDEFIEHANFVDNYYGTLKSEVERITKNGNNVFLEIELQGALQVMEKMNVVSIFILPPKIEDLEKRLIKRDTEDLETIKSRVEQAKYEIQHCDKYKYQIINDDLDKAIGKIRSIFNNELGL